MDLGLHQLAGRLVVARRLGEAALGGGEEFGDHLGVLRQVAVVGGEAEADQRHPIVAELQGLRLLPGGVHIGVEGRAVAAHRIDRAAEQRGGLGVGVERHDVEVGELHLVGRREDLEAEAVRATRRAADLDALE